MYIINTWINAIQRKASEKDLFNHLSRSYPPLVSITFTRCCNLSCKHCVYPPANQSDIQCTDLSRINSVIEAAHKVGVKDLIHVGRTLQPEHLPLLKKHQNTGMTLHLIDNGSSARLLSEIQRAGICFKGGIDISADGYESTHEKQRGKGSWQMVINSIHNLSTVADHISLTGTASTANWETIASDMRSLRREFPSLKIIQLTTTSPAHHHKEQMDLSSVQMQHIFSDMLQHSNDCEQNLLIYRLEDLTAIIHLLPKKYSARYISIEWKINKLKVAFFPQSIVTAEEFAIDSNGRHILPFGLDWHLDERPEEWEQRDDLILTNPDESYRKLVRKYQRTLGNKIFQEERKIFQKYFQ